MRGAAFIAEVGRVVSVVAAAQIHEALGVTHYMLWVFARAGAWGQALTHIAVCNSENKSE
jgi:hypothetical protein